MRGISEVGLASLVLRPCAYQRCRPKKVKGYLQEVEGRLELQLHRSIGNINNAPFSGKSGARCPHFTPLHTVQLFSTP